MSIIFPIQSDSNQDSQCRICLQNDKISNLIKPCQCKGFLQFYHQNCLKKWIKIAFKSKQKPKCQLCRHQFKIQINKNYKFTIKKERPVRQFLILSVLMFIDIAFWIYGIFILIIQQWDMIYRLMTVVFLISFAIALLFPIYRKFKDCFIEVVEDWLVLQNSARIQSIWTRQKGSFDMDMSRQTLRLVPVIIKPKSSTTLQY